MFSLYTMKGYEFLESLENARKGSFLSREGDTLSRVYIMQGMGFSLWEFWVAWGAVVQTPISGI